MKGVTYKTRITTSHIYAINVKYNCPYPRYVLYVTVEYFPRQEHRIQYDIFR